MGNRNVPSDEAVATDSTSINSATADTAGAAKTTGTSLGSPSLGSASQGSANETGDLLAGTIAPETTQISTAKVDGLGLSLQRDTASTKLRLETSSKDPIFDVLTMQNPPRLVVDLMGEKINAKSKSYPIQNDSYVKNVRVGAHNDKTRIVFDLTDLASNTDIVEQRIDAESGALVVSFNRSGVTMPAATAKATLDSVNDTAKSAGTNIEPPVTTVAAANNNALNNNALNNNALNNNAEITVKSLSLSKNESEAGKIVVGLSDRAAYDLQQTAPSEYVLTIPGSKALDITKTPQIAPAGKAGIRTVRAVQEGENTLVRVFVDAGTGLRAQPEGNSIVLKTTGVAKDPSARAQMKPEEEAAKVAEAPKTAAAESAPQRTPAAEAASAKSLASTEAVIAADGSRQYLGRLISLDLQDTDIDNALRIIAEVSNLNIIASDDVSGKVTLRLIDVPWDQALDVILKTNGLDQVREGNVIRIAPVEKLRAEREALKEAKRAAEELEDLQVKYIRVSYARVTDIKEQVEAVLTERGSVSADERTNQVIVKDIGKGQMDVSELVRKLDLRTPQVLLETQIVEASRSILRDMGFQWGFNYVASPAVGNSTGSVFPNSINVDPSVSGGNPYGVDFGAANVAAGSGSAITAILDSADGSRALTARLSAYEREGKVSVISRPQVATINNKEAEIKSVETVRIRLPDSGTSVATGSGATASGGGSTAFEEIEVGIELRVTPQASPDYYVLLDVNAKSSTFGDRVVDNIPSTFERIATSTVLVKSGQTFALGGVYRLNDRDSVRGVPFFKDIPVIGNVFRNTLMDKSDEELIFFITPHIVEGSFDPSLM